MLDRLKELFQLQQATQQDGLLKQPQATGGLLGGLTSNPNLILGASIIGQGVKGKDPFSSVIPALTETGNIQKLFTPKIQKTKKVFDTKLGKEVFVTERQLQLGNKQEPNRYTGQPTESIASKLETSLSSKYISAKPVSDFNSATTSVKKLFSGLEADNGAGDLASIFTFMKTLDPGSVVREGEFATAENSSGVFRKFWNLNNKLLRGKRLDPKQVEEFKAVGIDLYKASVEGLDQFRTGFNKISDNKGLNTENIFVDVDFRPTTIQTPEGKKIKTPAGTQLMDYKNGKYYWKIPGFDKPYETDGRGL
tara:strand:- start:2987 stop:3910 length:924 start_codon:yes stop_codon:yes gene_type:complete